MGRARVTYFPGWERRFPRQAAGRRAFGVIGDKLVAATKNDLRRTGLGDDPLARDYFNTLETEPTDKGVRMLTTSPTAHIVEWGSVNKEPDAPMRTAARRFGRFTET